MENTVSYKIKIKGYNGICQDTLDIYHSAVDGIIKVCLDHYDQIEAFGNQTDKLNYMESLIHTTKTHTAVCDFDKQFHKFPSYLRRAATKDAFGKVSSYKSNLANGTKAGLPKAGHSFPTFYKDGMYKEGKNYTAMIKIYRNNDWVWLPLNLRKSDVDYIRRHCSDMEQSSPTLIRKGKEWFLQFAFTETKDLVDVDPWDSLILAVDLGINHACTCSVMDSNGTIHGRHIQSLPEEIDRLNHAIGRIKKAQQHGARKMPRLWAKANGYNDDIAAKTAQYIMDVAVYYNVQVIVFEHLDKGGKKRGSKKQKLHLWKACAVQDIVTCRAHAIGMRVSSVNAWGTSKLAYDGSGKVLRGKDANLSSYSVCRFQTGKVYNCDLSASYNIGARYFIREILKSLPVTVRLDVQAKVPELYKRSTCTWSSLIRLHAVLVSSGCEKLSDRCIGDRLSIA